MEAACKLKRVSAVFLLILVALSSFSQSKELKKLSEEARKNAEKGHVELAESLYQDYVERYRQLGEPKGFQYSENLSWLAQRAAQKGQTRTEELSGKSGRV